MAETGDIELGPIRPPSEAQSLLIRVTRNCPWNQCEFCHTYKGERFSFRPVEEIKKDIDQVAEICEQIRKFSWTLGYAGEINRQVLTQVLPARALGPIAGGRMSSDGSIPAGSRSFCRMPTP